MTQDTHTLDLFDGSRDKRDKRGKVRPAGLTALIARRDRGIRRAAEHADREVPAWSATAVGYVTQYARMHAEFLAEDVRDFAVAHGFVGPPDGRAWGAVLRRAARDGVVAKAGFRAARSSNLSPKVLWRSLVRG